MDDFFLIEEQFTPESLMLRDSVRRFVVDEALPIIPEAFEQARFPTELLPRIAELGLLGMTLPTQYGGSEAQALSYGLACQELERGDSSLRSFVSVQSSLCMYPIYLFGTEEQKNRWLPAMAKAKVIGCFGLTESDSGSDPNSMKTTAKKVSGGWRINGSKMWITNAPIADIALIWAKVDQTVRGFIVETSTKGFQAREIEKKLSLRASSTGEISLNDCFVPDESLLPGTENGLKATLNCLNQARFGIAWGAIGAAKACYICALDYCKQREQFGKPLVAKQLIQKELVDMVTEITKADCLNYQLTKLIESDQATPAMVSLAKMNACKQALTIARSARNLLGANGISLEYPVIRHMNNLESVFTYEGTDNIHHLIVGKEICGVSAF